MEKDFASDLKGIIVRDMNVDRLPTYICTTPKGTSNNVISSPTACHKRAVYKYSLFET